MNNCSVLKTQPLKANALLLPIIFLLSSYFFSLSCGAEIPDEASIVQGEQPSADMAAAHNSRMAGIIALKYELEEKILSALEIEGKDSVYERIEKNHNVAIENEIAQARPTHIAGEIAYVVRPTDSNTTYIFLDKKNMEKSAKHLYNVYIPRQHHFAGSSRKDKINGRDTVVVWLDEGSTSEAFSGSIETYNKLKRKSAAYWKEYFKAIYKKPTRGDIFLGQISAGFQVLAGLGAGWIYMQFNPEGGLPLLPAILNYVWGSVIGTYHRTYSNFLYPFAQLTGANKIKSALKGSIASATYAYTLIGLSYGISSVNVFDTSKGKVVLNFFNLSAAYENLRLGTSFFISNNVKNAIRRPVRLREEARANTNTIEIPIYVPTYKKNKKKEMQGETLKFSLNLKLNKKPGKINLKQGDEIPGLKFSKVTSIKLSQKGLEYQLLAEIPANIAKNVDVMGTYTGFDDLARAFGLESSEIEILGFDFDLSSIEMFGYDFDIYNMDVDVGRMSFLALWPLAAELSYRLGRWKYPNQANKMKLTYSPIKKFGKVLASIPKNLTSDSKQLFRYLYWQMGEWAYDPKLKAEVVMHNRGARKRLVEADKAFVKKELEALPSKFHYSSCQLALN